MHEKHGEYDTQGKSSAEFVIPKGYVTGDEFARRVKEGDLKKMVI